MNSCQPGFPGLPGLPPPSGINASPPQIQFGQTWPNGGDTYFIVGGNGSEPGTGPAIPETAFYPLPTSTSQLGIRTIFFDSSAALGQLISVRLEFWEPNGNGLIPVDPVFLFVTSQRTATPLQASGSAIVPLGQTIPAGWLLTIRLMAGTPGLFSASLWVSFLP
jgi:hypothetical protein